MNSNNKNNKQINNKSLFNGKMIVQGFYLGLSNMSFEDIMKEQEQVVKGYFKRILNQFVKEHPKILGSNIDEISCFHPKVWHIFAYYYEDSLEINIVEPFIEVYFKKDILIGYKKYRIADEFALLDIIYYILNDANSMRHKCLCGPLVDL
jgi:hypothetical protein